MSRWDSIQKAGRKARIRELKSRVRAAIMFCNGRSGERAQCMEEGCQSVWLLCVDHPQGRTWNVRRPNEETRWRRYWRELDAGLVLRLLCAKHSGRDGRKRFQGKPRWRNGPAARWTPDMAAPTKPLAISDTELVALRAYLDGGI